MYFGGTRGFSSFIPREVKDNPHRPPVIVVRFQAGDRDVRPDALADGIELEYGDNTVAVQVAALDFTIPGDNRYAHRLEGFDEDWIDDGARRFIRYTNLPPGSYTLRVKASNNDLVWNEDGLAIPIVILEPFWMSWWFRVLVVLSALLVGG